MGDVFRYAPSFNGSALTSHDSLPGPHSRTGWPVNPDNMPIGNGRFTALVWGDGNHASTAGIGLLLARDDAWTEINGLVKLGIVRVQLTPDPFLNASSYSQTLDLASGDVLITAVKGAHRVQLRVAASNSVEALTVQLISSSKPVVLKASLQLWRKDGAFPSFNDPSKPPSRQNPFSTDSVRGACPLSKCGPKNESVCGVNKTQRADIVGTGIGDVLAWHGRNEQSVLWKQTLENQLQEEGEAYVRAHKDPLLHRTFGGLVVGHTHASSDSTEALTWSASADGRTLSSSAAVSSASFAVLTHTSQTAAAAKSGGLNAAWLQQVQATAARAAPQAPESIAASCAAAKKEWAQVSCVL